MRIKKSFLLLIIISVILFTIYLFYPKYVGSEGYSWNGPNLQQMVEYDCMGYKYLKITGIQDTPESYYCIGIPVNKKCLIGERTEGESFEESQVDCNTT